MAGQRTSQVTARTDNPELARAREYLAELEARLAIDGSTGEPTSQRIFDAGRLGLEFFRAFGPSYARLRDKTFNFESDILGRYNAQREIAFGKLRADAERFAQLCSAMTETDLDYRNSASSLFDYWHGDAAEAAKARVTGFLTSAGSVWARINAFGDTLAAACRAAERIAFDKAKAVLGLAADTVGGLTAEDVEPLVEIAALANGVSLTNDQLADAAELAEVTIAPATCRANRDVLNMVLDSAQDWLDQAFAPYYEARLAVFEAACDSAQANLDLVWASVEVALGELAARSVGTFADQPEPAPVPGPAAVSGPAPVSGSAVGPGPAPATTVATRSVPAGPAAQPAHSPGQAPTRLDDPAGGVRGGSIAARLNPDRSDQVDQVDQAQNHGGTTGSDGSDQGQGQPGEHTATLAATPAGGFGGGSFLPPPRATPGGNEPEHKRKVPVKGDPVPADPETAAPTGVIGGADDPAAYNEAQQFDDDSPAPRPEKKPEPVATVWRLTEDGEIESVAVPKTRGEKE